MEILKEFRQRIGRENIIITLWDNESIDIEYGGVTMSFKSLWQLEGFLELLENDIEIMKEKTASNMEKKDWKKKLRELSFMKGYYFKLEDNGLVEKKDDQLVFNREELERFVQQELDKAREEGRKEVLENELFIGDYDVLERGLRIRTVGRENFLAQIYKTCKDEYDWAFGTATYDQAIKQIENSLNSTLTPYVGTDKMVNEARIKVLSKLSEKEE